MTLPLIDIHTHSKSNQETIAIRSYRLGVETPDRGLRYSLGIHPWDVNEVAQRSEELLRDLDHDSTLLAIGETGLDYARENDRDLQRRLFRAQIDIAHRKNLPLIIHCVKAYEDTIRMLHESGLHTAVVFHGYVGSPELTRRLVAAGYYLSYGIRSLHSPKALLSLRNLPVERLFLESDDSSVPISDLYRQIAVHLNITHDELAACIYKNYERIFHDG